MMANDSVLVTNWTGLLAKGTTRNLACFMSAWPYSITAKQAHHGSDTWRSIWKVLRWSFDALTSGKHPSVDQWGFAMAVAHILIDSNPLLAPIGRGGLERRSFPRGLRAVADCLTGLKPTFIL